MTCWRCDGPLRMTVIQMPVPLHPDDSAGVAISHCLAHPEHDCGEPYLSAINARRREVGETEWLKNDRNPWQKPETP